MAKAIRLLGLATPSLPSTSHHLLVLLVFEYLLVHHSFELLESQSHLLRVFPPCTRSRIRLDDALRAPDRHLSPQYPHDVRHLRRRYEAVAILIKQRKQLPQRLVVQVPSPASARRFQQALKLLPVDEPVAAHVGYLHDRTHRLVVKISADVAKGTLQPRRVDLPPLAEGIKHIVGVDAEGLDGVAEPDQGLVPQQPLAGHGGKFLG
mmetsp:Transcript_23190/g.58110  ORF Transcript_23190/g.58110 Transcript_23190/m.58110 type:complete len:207 (+) Transcript_23190:254-874(+)